jgi:hypothetical protein
MRAGDAGFFAHVCQTNAVTDAWQRGQDLTIHGCVYGLHDGLLRDLGLSVAGTTDAGDAYAKALGDLGRLWSGQAAIGVSDERSGGSVGPHHPNENEVC